MKKLISILVASLLSQIAFAEDTEFSISEKCLSKITLFSTHFAKASTLYYGKVPVSIGKVTVNNKALTDGESGFANGKGSYKLSMKDEGKTVTTQVDFSFQFVIEPHCAVTKIQVSDFE